VEDTPENIAKIETVLSYWDQRPKQVIIEAKILEVELTDDMSFGVNWEKVLGDVRIGTKGLSRAILPTTTEPVSPVPATGTGVFGNVLTSAGTSHQFAAALDALQTKTKLNTLSTPKIVALHGETAKVQVGGQQGYRVTTVNEGVSTETVEFIETGTILEITPNIDDEGNILLYVRPSINSARIEEDGIPVVRTTTVTTRLLVKNGETAFIGGLIQDTKTKTRDKIPVLGSIPVLGMLFRRTSNSIGKSELVVLITPKILEAESELVELEVIDKTIKMEESFKKETQSTSKQLRELLMPTD
jgi:type II secretory pathway component GspD/PulD (secretin)